MNGENTKPYYLHIAGEIQALSATELEYSHIDKTFTQILTDLDINVIKNDFHEFSGGGLSIVYILSASHLAIHTWPEYGFLHFDLVTCSPKTDFDEINEKLKKSYPEAAVKASALNY